MSAALAMLSGLLRAARLRLAGALGGAGARAAAGGGGAAAALLRSAGARRDEEANIGETLRSLRALEWPAGRSRILVVADNCSIGPRKFAAAEGAWVLRRVAPSQCGKGYAPRSGSSAASPTGTRTRWW